MSVGKPVQGVGGLRALAEPPAPGFSLRTACAHEILLTNSFYFCLLTWKCRFTVCWGDRLPVSQWAHITSVQPTFVTYSSSPSLVV